MHALFDQFAHRYDLHTPPRHYQHDHELVLTVAREVGPGCRMLDIGCGTGVLLEKASRAGISARGIDASPGMIRVARARAGDAVALRRMQDIDDEGAYDLVVALSWTLNYCAGLEELGDVLRRIHRALRRRGRALLQVAHAGHTDGEPMEDREPGPTGTADDVIFSYRFERLDIEGSKMRAEYSYACGSLDECLREEHVLHVTDARLVSERMHIAGFRNVVIYDSWRRDAFSRSASPFILGVKEVSGA